jgi:hypothetical protein
MAAGRRRESLQELDLTRPAASTRPLRMYATHHTASTTCRATAGHMRAPTSPSLAPASARTAPAAQLYSSIIAINPRTARLGPSSRASQQPPPNESNAAPATRPTINAAGASSDAPSNNPATNGGDNSSVTPIDVSTTAVTISRFLPNIGRPNNRSVSFGSVVIMLDFMGSNLRSGAFPQSASTVDKSPVLRMLTGGLLVRVQPEEPHQ